jgi:hypothetical protein
MGMRIGIIAYPTVLFILAGFHVGYSHLGAVSGVLEVDCVHSKKGGRNPLSFSCQP